MTMAPNNIDPVNFTIDLISCPSVTPIEGGALNLLEEVLKDLGFKTKRYVFEDVDNLYARLGDASPNLCFAGHTDVVPTGDLNKWNNPPFEAKIIDGDLFGRGACDMKSAIAAWVAAVQKYLTEIGAPKGSISLLITGDEEGAAINGTRKLLPAIAQDGEKIDHCIVGEPTCPEVLGDMIKNGRRGSINCTINSHGVQGHVAYPTLAKNPIPPLVEVLHLLQSHKLDDGAEGFQPSNLEIVTIDVGNPASNVIPENASARFNIRFNTNHSGNSLKQWIEKSCDDVNARMGAELKPDIAISGEPFFTKPCHFTDIIQDAAMEITGLTPELSTTGGTSDARFIKDYCPVVEFGIVGKTLHKINENVATKDIYALRDIYYKIIEKYFNL